MCRQSYFNCVIVIAAQEHVFMQPPSMKDIPPPSAPDVTVRVHIDVSAC